MCLQLNESNDADPFVCFRRRDAKAVWETRRTDNTPANKITRPRMEPQQVSGLAASVVMREMKKAELGKDSQNVFGSPVASVRQEATSAPLQPTAPAAYLCSITPPPTAPVGLPSGAALFRTILDVARAKESRRPQCTEPTVDLVLSVFGQAVVGSAFR